VIVVIDPRVGGIVSDFFYNQPHVLVLFQAQWFQRAKDSMFIKCFNAAKPLHCIARGMTPRLKVKIIPIPTFAPVLKTLTPKAKALPSNTGGATAFH
jgi:hypothetical protein